jgi:hypothetical protein
MWLSFFLKGGAMATLAFDTLDHVKKLKAVGVPEEQAEVQAQALAGLLASDQLVTKQYLDMRLPELKTDLPKWFFGIAAGKAALIVTLLRLIR